MSRWITDTFVTASIGAGASLVINRPIPNNAVNLGKIKVVPGSIGVTSQVLIFAKATALDADMAYKSLASQVILSILSKTMGAELPLSATRDSLFPMRMPMEHLSFTSRS